MLVTPFSYPPESALSGPLPFAAVWPSHPVAATPEFTEHPKVADAASKLLRDVLATRPSQLHRERSHPLKSWADEDGNYIQVGFDEGGRVLSKVYFLAPSLSFQERMKRKIQKRIRALWP